ncbi:MAG: hypothetical protein IPH75_00620 [bacterium]|nr:hypothetical protein [bacterium]
MNWVRSSVALCLVLLFSMATLSAQEQSPTVEHRYARIYLDNPGQMAAVDSSLVIAQQKLERLLRDTMNYRPDLYVVGDAERFDQLIGGKFPDWGAAAAIPTRGRIVIKSPDRFVIQKSLSELVAHEYSHLALADRLGIREAPRWLDEGIAMYVAAEWGWSQNLAMSKAAIFRQFITLSDIDRVNRFTAGKAEVAYAQSYLAVKYFVDQYGLDALTILLDDIASGKRLDSALMRSTGSNLDAFEIEYHEYLTQRYNLTSFLMDTFWLWIFLAFVVVIGGFMKYRRRRQYYKKWEEQERLESTDFQYGKGRAEEVDPDEDDEPWRR